MARHAEGWTIRLPEGRTIWTVRFVHEGRSIEKSTGERDRGRASERAAEIYAKIVTGYEAPQPVSTDLVEMMGEWVADYEATHATGTGTNAKGYAKTFLSFFGGIERMTAAGYSEFERDRIGRISRSTVRKELSGLRMFREWLKTEKGISVPEVPGLPKRGLPGTRAKNARKRSATILCPEEIEAILKAMPEKGLRSGSWVKPFFRLCWETSLRPYSTIGRIETPLHYVKGSKTLFIAREIDKVRYERTIPITEGAQDAFQQVMRKGILFERLDDDSMRFSLKAALKKSGITKPVSIYDFRHSRISQWANSGRPLAGVAFLAGHKDISMTARYVKTSMKAAEAVLQEHAAE
jgi:integrase